MFNGFINFLSEFWLIFSFSFLVALTGAMSPGPLLTYTIIKSAKTNRRGYLMGLWIITGHAILEMGIIILLLLGFSFVLKNIAVVRIIGVSGGLILILFGASIIRDIVNGNISTNFLNSRDELNKDPGLIENKGIENPIIGGIMVSMSNPYWWVWWATIGFAFMIQFNISFKKWPKLLAFFLGHEAGDLIWYLLVSTLAFFGLRHMNRKAYYGILMFCALFMVLFGIYLGISPFLKNTM
ncbi:MAG: LysE family translocator [Desulfobacteraceae bacterium]|nr:LysE family translocator [Desulfobacteraceae bacterium]